MQLTPMDLAVLRACLYWFWGSDGDLAIQARAFCLPRVSAAHFKRNVLSTPPE